MYYGKPDELLRLIIGVLGLPKDDLSHTVLGDFEHVHAYT